MPVEIVAPRVLLVEGKDEELFFRALIEHMGLQNIQIMGIAGKTNLRSNLKALTLSPRFPEVTSLGIVRDADDDPGAAFQSVRDALQAANLSVPTRPLVLVGDSPRVTVMILPAENTPGMLEDVCLKAVEKSPAMACVEQYFQCLQQQGSPLPRNVSKARVQVFLASRSEAGKRLGEAAQAGYWPWAEEALAQLRNFLQQIGS